MSDLIIRATRSINKGKVGSIGLVMNFKTDTTSGYVGEIIKGILWGLREIRYDLKLVSREQFHSLPRILKKSEIDGLIVTHGSRDLTPNLQKEIAKKNGVSPLVIINDYNPALETNQLYVDSYKASLNMTRYLLKSGHREFYVIGAEHKAEDAIARKQALVKILKKDRNKTSKLNFIDGHFNEDGGYTATKQILRKEPDFKGVLYCLNDAMAIGALHAISEEGLSCPEDIKIIGFDGIPYSRFTNPPLTTIRFPLVEMGYHSVQVIYKILKGEAKKHVKKEFLSQLVVRRSC